jgi:hypothetical protein
MAIAWSSTSSKIMAFPSRVLGFLARLATPSRP